MLVLVEKYIFAQAKLFLQPGVAAGWKGSLDLV